MKVCTKCGEEKDESEFKKSGNQCKECICIVQKEYRQRNRQRIALYRANYYKKNKSRLIKRAIEWQKETEFYKKRKNKQSDIKKRKEWVKNNQDKVNGYKKKWQRLNPEKVKAKETNLRLSLSDSYVNEKLRRRGFKKEMVQCCPELRETLKIIIKTQRLWRKSQTSKNLEKV